MSDIAGELARVRGAFDQPTLTLLHQKLAPAIIAIFRSAFGREVRSVGAARLHDQVDAYLAELRLAGTAGDLPSGDGKDLCQRWVKGRWLIRTVDDESGEEVYQLTSHAQDAMALVKSLTRDRATLSEHRIATIMSAVRRFNAEANPNPLTRVSILDSEIDRLTSMRDRIEAGEVAAEVTGDYMLEGYTELLGLVAGLPSDFARVIEAFARLRTDILASFRAEDRPAGEVVDDYLARADSLMTATPEGRAFEGAFGLLRDDELLLQLREDLAALVAHPLSGDILLDADRRELRSTVSLIQRGLDDVLAQRTRVSATLREYIVSHDITRDRELDQTLRQVESELTTWMDRTGPRSMVDLPLMPSRVDVDHLRERFYDPASDVPVPPLRQIVDDLPEELSLEDLRRQGGPTLVQLRAALAEALLRDDPGTSLGDVFAGLPEELRRPVEIFGLLHLATGGHDPIEDGTMEDFATVRPDGSRRTFSAPRLLPKPAAHHEPDQPDQPRQTEVP